MAALKHLAQTGRQAAIWTGTALLRSYAAVLFSRSPMVGLLLLLATATVPRALLGGAIAVLTAIGAARLFELDAETVRDGNYGVSPLLLGLGIAQTLGLSGQAVLLLVVLSTICVVVTAALRSWFAASHLPQLSIPFLIIYYLLLRIEPYLGIVSSPPPIDQMNLLPESVAGVFRSVGSLLFLPRVDAGVLLFVALLLHSRIALLLAALAVATVAGLKAALPELAASESISSLTYNALFTAIAIGGVWFVPSPSSMLLALLGVLFCGVMTMGAAGPFAHLGIPLLIVPFNAVVIIMLLAMRQRVWDWRPKSVDFTPGTPEENLAYFRTRLLRFRWLYPTRFRLPVRGTWMCTQGVDGPLSHQGQWRHAFDFEVAGSDGSLHASQGELAGALRAANQAATLGHEPSAWAMVGGYACKLRSLAKANEAMSQLYRLPTRPGTADLLSNMLATCRSQGFAVGPDGRLIPQANRPAGIR